jgi:hypothetical protein
MAQMFIFGGLLENKTIKLRNKCFWHLEYNSKKRKRVTTPLTRTQKAGEAVTLYSATSITDTDSRRAVTYRLSSLRPFVVMQSLAR